MTFSLAEKTKKRKWRPSQSTPDRIESTIDRPDMDSLVSHSPDGPLPESFLQDAALFHHQPRVVKRDAGAHLWKQRRPRKVLGSCFQAKKAKRTTNRPVNKTSIQSGGAYAATGRKRRFIRRNTGLLQLLRTSPPIASKGWTSRGSVCEKFRVPNTPRSARNENPEEGGPNTQPGAQTQWCLFCAAKSRRGVCVSTFICTPPLPQTGESARNKLTRALRRNKKQQITPHQVG